MDTLLGCKLTQSHVPGQHSADVAEGCRNVKQANGRH
jgi:hypothetical protein